MKLQAFAVDTAALEGKMRVALIAIATTTLAVASASAGAAAHKGGIASPRSRGTAR